MSAGDENMQETDRELLIRLDERVRSAVATMEQRDIYHRQEMDRLTKLMVDQTQAFMAAVTNISANFASKTDLTSITTNVTRVERIVYGACAVILLAVIGALASLVIKGGAA